MNARKPATSRGEVRLDQFDNSGYRPGRSLGVRIAWLVTNRAFFLTWVPWPSSIKARLLRLFGARVGTGVVFKNRINIKYPWNIDIGSHAWVGEGVWIDSLGKVTVGAHCCLSQGAMIETGNHDWSNPKFDLIIGDVIVEDGAWVAVRSLLLPGSRLRTHAILAAGSTLSGDSEPYGIYSGNPARKMKERVLRSK